MTSYVNCLKTGCGLITHKGWAWGDLFRIGSTYIFNAILDESGEARWEFAEDKPLNGFREAVVQIPDGQDFFERRGIIVFDDFHHNQVLDKYLEQSS